MDFLTSGLFSFLTTIIFIPFVVVFAKKYSLLDNPNTRPHPAHVQNRIVPRAGGLACFIAIALSCFIFFGQETYIPGILFSIFILLMIGLADDKFQNFSPYYRLGGQFVAAFIFVTISNVGIKFITNPLGGIIFLNYFSLLPNILAVIWIVWVMNMTNWSKGVDGQMPGIMAVASIFLGVLSLKFALAGDPSQNSVALLSFITTGTSLGLLLFNWYPAKIFPGFSGSTILGFMVATLAILAGAKLATAGLVLLIPATDFVYIFIRRILEGRSPVWGDKGHLHHKLLTAGFSHRQISLFYILLGVILGSVALSLDSKGKLFAAILTVIFILGLILWLTFFGELSKPSDPDNG